MEATATFINGSYLSLQVVRAIICWILSVGAKPPDSSFLTLYGRQENWTALSVRGVAGAGAMASYYFGLQFLPLGDAVRTRTLCCPVYISRGFPLRQNGHVSRHRSCTCLVAKIIYIFNSMCSLNISLPC